MKNDELLHKWYNNTLSESELNIFKQRPEFDSLVTLKKNSDNLEGPEFDQELMLSDILNSSKGTVEHSDAKKDFTISQYKDGRSKFSIIKLIPFGIAASLLFLAGYFLFPKANIVNYEIANDQKVEGTLPDQSTFVLNGDSHLSYDKDKWEQSRDITLAGEAFFSVQKGSTFTVTTNRGTVQVLGTQFNVKARSDIFDVRCKEGKVAVNSNSNSLILTAGESALLQGDKKSILRTRELTKIKNATLETVLNEVSDRYDIDFETTGIDLTNMLSCNFQYKDLDLALKTTVTPLGITYLQSDNRISLSK